MAGPVIRRAQPTEAAGLSELALRSKAHWGYDDAFLEACRDVLTLSPADVEAGAVFVAEFDGAPAGFYRLGGGPPEAELEDLWVDPETMGRGVGSALLAHAAASARKRGCTSVLVESDPHAEGFYRSQGAQRVGERTSSVDEGRQLPLLRLELEGAV
jgi:ribosomal protein S18 acetylase RimI-like enzyme